ncbi:MAG: glycosyltransferase family 4 protein [Gammaproteobacteria bacterium]
MLATPARKKILLVTRNLPPLLGGMERLNLHLALELAKAFEVDVVGPSGCRAQLPTVSYVEEIPHRPLWRFLSIACMRTVQLARKRRPDCIVAGSGLTAPITFIAARLCGAHAVVYVHGLDLVAAHPVYRLIWRPFLRRMDLCIANSRHTADLAAHIGIPSARTTVLNPGVELPEKHDPAAAMEFRRRHDLGERKLLLSVGRLTPRKGLLEFIERSLPAITATYSDAILLVVGDEAPHALTGSGAGMGQRIMHVASSIGLKDNVRILGAFDDSVLSAAYQAADVLVFPVRSLPGDVEGFGMVAIEAAAHGLPTIAFAVGGVSDAVADGQSGWLVPAGDYAQFARRVQQVLAEGATEVSREKCRQFALGLAWDRFGAKLRRILNRLDPAPAVIGES